MEIATGLAALAVLAPGNAGAAADVPTVAGHWTFRYRAAGAPLEVDYSFRPCDGCAAIVGVSDPGRPGTRPVRMKRRGRLFVGIYRSDSYCGYKQVIRFRPGRGRTVEGQRFAVRGSGTFTSRRKGCSRGTGGGGTLRFRARRISLLRVVEASISSDELGDGCDTLRFRLEGEPGSFPDNFRRRPHSFRWEFGDGATSTERRPRHTFPSPGRYPVTVAIRLTDGSVARVTEPVDVAEPAEGC